MTITRLFQSGAELNTLAEFPAQFGGGASLPTISETKARTGTYSVRNQGAALKSLGITFSPVTQIRAGVWLNHNGLQGTTSSYQAILFRWTTPASNANYLRWSGNTATLNLVIAGTEVANIAIASAGLSAVDTWYHVGINLFADATAGWASVYVDGVKVLGVTAANLSTAISEFLFGGVQLTAGWANYAYFDDFYVDATPGEADEAVPQKRFLWAVANGNGASSQWTGNDANSVDNYLLVDDVTPDSDTTYVYTQAVDQKDTYALANLTVPVGYVIVAAIPTALAKRAGVTEQLKLVTFDGVTTILSAAKVPAAAYAPVWDRQPLMPNGAAWTEAGINAAEVGVQSAGTF